MFPERVAPVILLGAFSPNGDLIAPASMPPIVLVVGDDERPWFEAGMPGPEKPGGMCSDLAFDIIDYLYAPWRHPI